MRLIDADKLRKDIHCAYSDDLEICEKIDAQPTAYDVDKVVRELEKAKTINVDVGFGTIYETIRKDVAIEIVKQGGVSDAVCEWKIDGDMAINPHNLSKYKIKQYDGLYALDTCQHCRKKIKAVE